MRNALKGALLSGLVWPGVGQLVLGRSVRGAVLMGATMAALTVVAAKTVQYALAILAKLETAAGPPDIHLLARTALDTMAVIDRPLFHAALAALAVCWTVGVLDAWRLGARRDRKPPAGRRTDD